MHKLLLVVLLFGAMPHRTELTKNPKYVEVKAPSYAKLTAEELRDAIEVLSARNGAVFGFNDGEVVIRLPKEDNSIFATTEFSEPKLLDKKGKPVKYELEQGIYDFGGYSNEVRFQKGVEYARAIGEITVRYPIVMKTTVLKKNGKSGVKIDGPFVTYDPAALPEPATFSKIKPLRAYDKAGRQLEQDDDSDYADGRQTAAFWGEVAEVRIDTVEEWATVHVKYDLPAVAKLPAAQAGMGGTFGETPGAKIEKTIVVETAEDGGSDSPEDVDVDMNADNFVMTAVQGTPEEVKRFLDAGLPVESKDSRDGVTPLQRAAFFGNLPVVRLLLEQGANPDAADENGTTALLAVSSRCDAVDIVKTMIAKGANVNARAKGSATPLMMAEVSNCDEIAKVLKKAGAKPWR